MFRIPLDGAAPSAIKTAGVPIDQMSFLEDGSGHLNVLLRESGAGEGMWGSERTHGAMALLRVPLAAFGDGTRRRAARALPRAAGAARATRCRTASSATGCCGAASTRAAVRRCVRTTRGP